MIGKRGHRVKNIRLMERALAKVWPKISKEALLKLNTSMPRRLDAYIKNKGGTTKY
jgi:hypothetical protein